MPGSSRWTPFALATLASQALAFGLGVAISVALALSVSPEPEKIGRVGLGIIVATALSFTPVVFVFGFMAAETARPFPRTWQRFAASSVCGVLYVLGWLLLSWVIGGVSGLLELPEWIGSAAFLAWWFVGPLTFPMVLWRMSSGRARSAEQGGAA